VIKATVTAFYYIGQHILAVIKTVVFACTEQMNPGEPSMDWQSVNERATNHLFFAELIKGCKFYDTFTVCISPSLYQLC